MPVAAALREAVGGRESACFGQLPDEYADQMH